MKQNAGDWRTDFPIHDEIEDYAGLLRRFVITCHEGGLGFTVRASEEGRDGLGYEFGAYSETSPYSALGRVRQKMQRCLATRHLASSDGDRRMLHDELRGRITSDGVGGVTLVVDGTPLSIDDLQSILSTHEGWEFEMRIVDALE